MAKIGNFQSEYVDLMESRHGTNWKSSLTMFKGGFVQMFWAFDKGILIWSKMWKSLRILCISRDKVKPVGIFGAM